MGMSMISPVLWGVGAGQGGGGRGQGGPVGARGTGGQEARGQARRGGGGTQNGLFERSFDPLSQFRRGQRHGKDRLTLGFF